MEKLNKEVVGSAIIQLAQERQLRREMQEQESSQRVMRIVDADPPVEEDPLVQKGRVPTEGSYSLSHLPSPAFPPLQSEPGVTCPRCKDRGYLRADVPYGHPQFGKLVECVCKQAKKNDTRREVLRRQSKLDELAAFQEESFETFQLWIPGVQEAYDAAIQFAEVPKGWLVLAGSNGCGKTHLVVAIAKRCLENGSTVLFAVVPDLLDRLRSAFAPTAEESFDEEFAKMREVEVLILDDLGAESATSWATEKLFQLLNYRYNARLATVFTTNKVGFEGIAPRLRSRLSDRRLVRRVTLTDAPDFRERELGE